MDVELHIEGVSDRTATDAIRKRVREVRALVAQPGEWRLTISPSETRGQWDVGLNVSSRQLFGSFDGAIDRLPDLLERQLRKFLKLPPSAADSS
jgi:hypothetical protein